MYEVRVWKLVGIQEFEELEPALKCLVVVAAAHGANSLGRVLNKETGDIVNEYYQPVD